VWLERLRLLLPALLGACALMAIVWQLAVRQANAGIVDIAWSAGFTPVAAYYAIAGDGPPARRALIASMTALWSLRLAVYLYRRVMSQHPVEDPRYQRLRVQWGTHFNRRLLGFFELQGMLLALLSLPILLACTNPRARLQPVEWLAVAVWIIALAGETVADRQLQRFKADTGHRGAVCEVGLWRYSRHPNYFFEWLIWVAYFLFALGSPAGWITLYCPLLMLYFLLRVTGIPMTERLALETKGAAFADYQRRTSAFFPWFPKSSERLGGPA
jgi:steroid 5-alpha reductase family enzyme